MKAIESTNKVREYPDETSKAFHTLIVREHWNSSDKIVLELDGKSYTFLAKDIKKAIENAQNAHNW